MDRNLIVMISQIKVVKAKGYREQTLYTKLRLINLQTMLNMAVTYSFFLTIPRENAQTSSSTSDLSKLLRKYRPLCSSSRKETSDLKYCHTQGKASAQPPIQAAY